MMEYVFGAADAQTLGSISFRFSVSYLEIYNECAALPATAPLPATSATARNQGRAYCVHYAQEHLRPAPSYLSRVGLASELCAGVRYVGHVTGEGGTSPTCFTWQGFFSHPFSRDACSIIMCRCIIVSCAISC